MWASRLAVAAACFLAAACTSDPEQPQTGEGNVADVVELLCEESDLAEPPSDGQALADGVLVPGSFSAQEAGRNDGLLFAKGGLWVQGDSGVRLAVVSPSEALVAWGKPGRAVRQVVVPPCDGADWRVWPGGFYVDGPVTVDLSVETAQKTTTASVGIA